MEAGRVEPALWQYPLLKMPAWPRRNCNKERKSFMPLDLLQKQPDRFGGCNADAGNNSLGRLLELRMDSSVTIRCFSPLLRKGNTLEVLYLICDPIRPASARALPDLPGPCLIV